MSTEEYGNLVKVRTERQPIPLSPSPEPPTPPQIEVTEEQLRRVPDEPIPGRSMILPPLWTSEMEAVRS